MNFIDFSNILIKSNDIDPDYVFLINHKNTFGVDSTFELFKKKILIYNLHSELLYINKFIKIDEIKFGNERQKSKKYFEYWDKNLSRLELKTLQKFNGVNYLVFRENFKKIKGMGDWACWKTADILEKVFNIKMKYDDLTFLQAYEYPLKGLLMLNNYEEDVKAYKDKKLFLRHLNFAKSLSNGITQNDYFNASNILELETLLCKYHSYIHKHYNPLDDLNKLRKIKLDLRLKEYHNLLP
jgi:hypothetical protein